MAFYVEVLGVEHLRDKLGRIEEGYQVAIREEIMDGVLAIEAGAKRRCPVRYGALRSSITHLITDGGLTGLVGTNKSYARPVEFGSRAHVIVARKAGALRFTVGDRVVFARSVRHPGTRAQPFLFPAFEEEIPNVRRRLTERLRDVARRGGE